MKEIILPALSEEQRYLAARILWEIGDVEWATAKERVARLHRAAFSSADLEGVERVRAALEKAGLMPEVRDELSGSDIGRQQMSHEDIRVRSLLHARPSFVRTTRFVSGVVSVVLLTLLFTWTERTAEIQTSGPQILQV